MIFSIHPFGVPDPIPILLETPKRMFKLYKDEEVKHQALIRPTNFVSSISILLQTSCSEYDDFTTFAKWVGTYLDARLKYTWNTEETLQDIRTGMLLRLEKSTLFADGVYIDLTEEEIQGMRRDLLAIELSN